MRVVRACGIYAALITLFAAILVVMLVRVGDGPSTELLAMSAIFALLIALIFGVIAVMLFSGSGRRRDRDRYERAHQALRDEIDVQKRSEARLLRAAYHDNLTGLPNRTFLREHIATQLQDRTRCFGLFLLDLDRFRVINASLDHAVGDTLLHVIAQRIKDVLPGDAVIGRASGDEFIACLSFENCTQSAERIANAMISTIRMPLTLDEREIAISVSVGVVLSAARYDDAEAMLRDADTAMYAAKTSGRDRFEIFDENMHEKAVMRLSLESQLRRGLNNDEFVPYYQPIVELKSGRVHALEALARWKHADYVSATADEFIPVAEGCGLIAAIDTTIFDQACDDALRLGDEFSEVIINVNISAARLRQNDVVRSIGDALRRTNIAGSRITLELTESSILDCSEAGLDVMTQLRELGTSLAIDDFGTGYSSLSYVHRLPISCLKIDRSFVTSLTTNPHSAAIVQTIVAMAKTLGFSVTAEGIETSEQFAMLETIGVDYGQGFYFSRPLPFEAVAPYVRARNRMCEIEQCGGKV
jgi:diguanylate cyclase (GGDEF)-like protein